MKRRKICPNSCALRNGRLSKEESVWRLIRYIKQLIRRLGLPESIQGAGIERKSFEAVLKEMAVAALQDPSTLTNPEICTEEEVTELSGSL